MRTKRLLLGAVAAVVLVLSTSSAPASGAPTAGAGAAGNAVAAWNAIAVSTLTGLPGAAGGAPPAAQVHVAMVQGAVFDAVNAIGHRQSSPYLLRSRFPARASEEAATATAAYGVLRHLVSTVPNLPDTTRTTLLSSLATQYASALAALPDRPSTRQGIAAGQAAAAVMIAHRRDDGRFGPSQWRPSTAVGHWSPQTNATGQVLDPTPWVGGVSTFVVRSASQFRTAGPLPVTSAGYAREFEEVKQLGAVNSTVRTPEQTYIARWWQSTPVASWNEVGRELAVRNHLSLDDTARLLAMQNLGGADASITCWNDKYHWDFWRPENAIPRAAEDGNPATAPDASWRPLISAPYPDIPSGHLCQDGAHTTVLRSVFGDRIAGGFTITSSSGLLLPDDMRQRTFRSFSQAVDEVLEARIWAGLHFRTADAQGELLGRRVVRYLLRNGFQRVGHGGSAGHGDDW